MAGNLTALTQNGLKHAQASERLEAKLQQIENLRTELRQKEVRTTAGFYCEFLVSKIVYNISGGGGGSDGEIVLRFFEKGGGNRNRHYVRT